jgi:hypothetical protein
LRAAAVPTLPRHGPDSRNLNRLQPEEPRSGRFGERIFDVIETQSARLEDVEGIGPKRRKRIKEAWAEQKVIRQFMRERIAEAGLMDFVGLRPGLIAFLQEQIVVSLRFNLAGPPFRHARNGPRPVRRHSPIFRDTDRREETERAEGCPFALPIERSAAAPTKLRRPWPNLPPPLLKAWRAADAAGTGE